VQHIGIDLGAKKSHIVVLSETGDVLAKEILAASELRDWLEKQDRSRVVMEACTQSPAVARRSQDAGHQTVVIPAHVVRSLGVAYRGIKTDERDALVLAQASVRNRDLPSVHLRTIAAQKRRDDLSARSVLVASRTRLVLHIKSWFRGQLIRLTTGAHAKTFADHVRKAAEAVGGLPATLEALVVTIETLNQQIAHIDQQAKAIAATDAVCKRLMTVPGVGPTIALAFSSHIDDIARFDSADALTSYMALVPGEATTGGKLQRTGTLKAGPLHLKAMLVQGAWGLWRSRPLDPAVQWARRIADKRGKRIAIIALARKLVRIMYAVWKHQTTYSPTHGKNISAVSTISTTSTLDVSLAVSP